MKLITFELEKRFEAVGGQSEDLNPIIIAKFFNPIGSGTWYVSEYEPEANICFGYVTGLGKNEWGYLKDFTTRYELRLASEIESHYRSDGSPVSFLTEYTYDNYGNVAEKITGKGLPYQIKETTTYVYNPDIWIVNRPKTRTLISADSTTVNERYFYDGAGSPDAVPTKGNLSRYDIFDARLGWISNRTTFNANGTVASNIDGRGQVTTYTYAAPELVHIENTTNPLGHVTTTRYSHFGSQILNIEASGLITEYERDALDRL